MEDELYRKGSNYGRVARRNLPLAKVVSGMGMIRKANTGDASLLTELGRITLRESHGHSAPKEEMDHYLDGSYTEQVLSRELEDPTNHYYILNYKDQPVGFSKIIFNVPRPEISAPNIAKLERIYVLREFHGLNLGSTLFEFNLDLAKKNDQAGIWLAVWTENEKALRFYSKKGFVKAGHTDFWLSPRHSNPNYVMWLDFKKIQWSS